MVLLLALACHDGHPGGKADGPTWSADVSPIVGRSCVGCHHEGGVGGVDFTTYASAAPMASAMASYTGASIMPPPAMDPDCRPYAGHERLTIADEERETIAAWAEADAPEGDPIDPLTWTAPSLADADTELHLPVAHAVSLSDDGNEYHCQILENPFTETTYVTGFDVLVDAPSVVHHSVLAIDRGGDAGTWTGDDDLSDGWDCREKITEDDWSMLHAWAPGMEPTEFQDGLGLRIEPGDQLVLQMHYFGRPEDEGTIDQSGYLLRTTTSVDTEIHMDAVGPSGFVLPAGEVSTEEDVMTNDYRFDITIYGVFPHMHLLATGYDAYLESPTGDRECLAQAGAWDFGHQATYVYDEPATWEPGQQLVTSCTWDNTTDNPNQYNDPVTDVSYGEGTNQEMCFFLFYYSY